MNLSNKKIKYIKRNASRLSCDQIARDLSISTGDVKKILNDREGLQKEYIIKILDFLLKYVPIALIFAAPHLFSRKFYDFANLVQTAFIQISVSFLLLVSALRYILDNKKQIKISKVFIWWAVFLFWALISITYAYNRCEGLEAWKNLAVCAIFFFIVINSIKSFKEAELFIKAAFISGLLSACLGIGQYIFNIRFVPQMVAPAACFANKNMAAQYMIIVLPLSLFLIHRAQKALSLFFYYIGAAFMCVFLFYTGTRAGWLVFIIQSLFLGVCFIFTKFRFKGRAKKETGINKKIKIAAFLAAMAVFLIMIHIGPGGKRISVFKYLDQKTEDIAALKGTSRLRLDIALDTLVIIKEHFLVGVGLGNHKIFYPLYRTKQITNYQLRYAHNDYLQLFAELGIIGMLFAGAFYYAVFRLIISSIFLKQPQYKNIFLISASCSVIGIMAVAMFSFPFHRAIPPLMLSLLLALITFISSAPCYEISHKIDYKTKKKKNSILSYFYALGAAALFIFFLYTNTLALRADFHFARSAYANMAKYWNLVAIESMKSYELAPCKAEAIFSLGRAYIFMKEYEKAADTFEKFTKLCPNYSNAYLNLGIAYTHIGRNHKAVEAYGNSLRIKYAKEAVKIRKWR